VCCILRCVLHLALYVASCIASCLVACWVSRGDRRHCETAHRLRLPRADDVVARWRNAHDRTDRVRVQVRAMHPASNTINTMAARARCKMQHTMAEHARCKMQHTMAEHARCNSGCGRSTHNRTDGARVKVHFEPHAGAHPHTRTWNTHMPARIQAHACARYRAELDRFCDAMISIRQEARLGSPHPPAPTRSAHTHAVMLT
jgi:NMD protein affecting ribosome stability and mRNA decay